MCPSAWWVVNGLDRLVLEINFPLTHAYFKIRQTIDEVNAIVSSASKGPARRLSPERGNVAFASTAHRYVFTLRSFAGRISTQLPHHHSRPVLQAVHLGLLV